MSNRKVLMSTTLVLTIGVGVSGAIAQPTWSLDGQLPEPLSLHGVAVVEGGIFVFGGYDGTQFVSTAYLYHVGGGSDPKAPLPAGSAGRGNMGFATCPDGHVWSIAGYKNAPCGADWCYMKDVWSYDPVADSWNTETALSYARGTNGAACFGGCVYTVGGHHEDTGHGFSLSLVERYDGASWQQVSPLNQDDTPHSGTGEALGREALCAVVVDGKVYAIGGLSYEKNHQSHEWGGWVEAYDAATDTWDDSLPLMPTPRTHFAVTLMGTRIYTIGGWVDVTGTKSDAVEYFDVVEGQWHTDTTFPFPVADAQAVTIGNRIYVVGGLSQTETLDTVYVMTLPVPAVSEWGLVAMTLLVLTAGTLVLMRRRRAVAAC